MTNDDAVKGLKHLKRFIKSLKKDVFEKENTPPSDWAVGFYNWCEDPISFIGAINIAIDKLEK